MEKIGSQPFVVQISSKAEWRSVLPFYSIDNSKLQKSPVGDWFIQTIEVGIRSLDAIFLHGGVGKIRAAASCQYAILTWRPCFYLHFGTCGGVGQDICVRDIILAERTVVYDAIERMASQEALERSMSTQVELDFLPKELPLPVKRGTIASADQDLAKENVEFVRCHFDALGADWESAAVAKVCELNKIRCLILRGVTDLPSSTQPYSDYQSNTPLVMSQLLATLAAWAEILCSATLGVESAGDFD